MAIDGIEISRMKDNEKMNINAFLNTMTSSIDIAVFYLRLSQHHP